MNNENKINNFLINEQKKRLRKNWEKRIEDINYWVESGKRNLFIADLLYKKYNHAWAKINKAVEEMTDDKIKTNDWLMTNIFRNILMQYGFAFECYIKAKLIKDKVIKIFDKDKKSGNNNLSEELCRHINTKFYSSYKNLPKINNLGKGSIDRLHRAVLSGKYPFEKKVNFLTYTGFFDEDIKFCKKYIKIIQKSLS